MAIAPAVTDELRVIVNTGDDFTLHGLHISPDVDTVVYTLSGIANPATGWGIEGDTDNVMEQLRLLGQEDWFWLGDRDIATHLVRTAALAHGERLTAVTASMAAKLGIPAIVRILPMSDDPVATEVRTADGWLAFQDYFVRRRHADAVRDVRFIGIQSARPQQLALEALRTADVVILCPSNPIVSIGPILAMQGMRDALAHRSGKRVAISPIIGGRALKGPADRMMAGLGYEVSAVGVARLYQGLVDLFVLDQVDAALAPAIANLGMRPLIVNTIMDTAEASKELALAITQAVWA